MEKSDKQKSSKLSNSQKNRVVIIAFFLLSIILWQIPCGNYILYPFTILTTWFHEMGHGVTALLLGGHFDKLELFVNGSGIASMSGSLYGGNIGAALVAAGGPLGPTIIGFCFLVLSKKDRNNNIILWLSLIMMILSLLIWVRTWFGVLFLIVFAGLIFLVNILGSKNVKRNFVRFLGVQGFLSIYVSFGYLFSSGAGIGGSSYVSDTGKIAEYLFLPNWFWASMIIIFSIYLFISALKKI